MKPRYRLFICSERLPHIDWVTFVLGKSVYLDLGDVKYIAAYYRGQGLIIAQPPFEPRM